MLVRDVGEFRLIELLAKEAERGQADPRPAPGQLGFDLKLSIGDDAAAWSSERGVRVLTTDTMVDGVHFRREVTPWSDLGWKAMAVNLSDVAAMGCVPVYAVVTLGLTGDLPVDRIVEMYRGMTGAGVRYGSVVVGGDVVRSPVLFVTVAMIGAAPNDDAPAALLTRSAALPGQKIAVTGHLGCSAGGLRVVEQDQGIDPQAASHLINAHNRPNPRIEEGVELARHGVTAAMDVSDGLLVDLGKLCEASGIGAVVRSDLVPVDEYLSGAFPDAWLDLALSGGEDYELLFTASSGVVDAVAAAVDVRVTVIGDTVNQQGTVRVVDQDGRPVTPNRTGWDHFRDGA